MAIAEKKCPKCHTMKSLDEFTIRKTGRIGHPVAHCKPCNTQSSITYQRNALARNPNLYEMVERPSKLRRLYGITVEQYEALLVIQNQACAICKSHDPGTRKYRRVASGHFSVDHCHATNIVRGLLCAKCNRAIGLLNDDPERAEALASYLRKW